MKAAIAAVIALAASSIIAQNAEGKTPAYVITGGELGPYAYHFFLGPEDESNFVDASVGLEAPRPLPALAYDLYNSWGNFAIPLQMANGGPELRYYPEPALLERRGDGIWLKLSASGAGILNRAIEEALVKKAAGELEIGAIAADFRARNMPEFTYHLNTYSPSVESASGNQLFREMWRSGEPIGVISRPEADTFVMRDLVETVSSHQEFSTGDLPRLGIYYSGQVGHTGYGGLLGFYSPPKDGLPGRFWPEDQNFYSDAAAYLETTPGFDAMIAEAIESAAASESATVEDPQSTVSVRNVAAAAVAGATLAVGLLLLGRKRRLDNRG